MTAERYLICAGINGGSSFARCTAFAFFQTASMFIYFHLYEIIKLGKNWQFFRLHVARRIDITRTCQLALPLRKLFKFLFLMAIMFSVGSEFHLHWSLALWWLNVFLHRVKCRGSKSSCFPPYLPRPPRCTKCIMTPNWKHKVSKVTLWQCSAKTPLRKLIWQM